MADALDEPGVVHAEGDITIVSPPGLKHPWVGFALGVLALSFVPWLWAKLALLAIAAALCWGLGRGRQQRLGLSAITLRNERLEATASDAIGRRTRFEGVGAPLALDNALVLILDDEQEAHIRGLSFDDYRALVSQCVAGGGVERHRVRSPAHLTGEAGRILWLLMAIVTGLLSLVGLVSVITTWVRGAPPPMQLIAGVFAFLVPLAAFRWAWRWCRAAVLTVGHDGITFPQGFKRRFLPYLAIAEVTAEGLLLKSGAFIQLTAYRQAPPKAALTAIRQRWQRLNKAAPESSELGLAHHARRGQSWGHGLKSVRESGYRQQQLTSQALFRVVYEPSSGADERVGAAYLLAQTDPDRLPPIRRLARGTQNPKLRLALERACDGVLDEAATRAALQAESRDLPGDDAKA